MSRSSGSEPTAGPPPSDPATRSFERAQAEPLAALVAVVAVCLALSLYTGVLEASLPGRSDRAVGDAAIERVERAVAPAGVAQPDRVERGPDAGPEGYETNVTIEAAGERWTAGPGVPETADGARKAIGVRVGPGSVRAGRLEVHVR